MVKSYDSLEHQILESWCMLEDQYLGIDLKIPTPTPAPDHPLGGTPLHPTTLLASIGRHIYWLEIFQLSVLYTQTDFP